MEAVQMKKDLHPKVFDTVIKCACGATFETKSIGKGIHVRSAPTVILSLLENKSLGHRWKN